jgi:LPS export ABC transporter permease LptG/LPS export ABC transporter permease LptF
MFKILDRYLVREILLPFVLALLVSTFILLMPPIMDTAQQLIEKGIDAGTIVRILVTLLPQSLCVTIPMAVIYGILMGLGRLSADREFVALQACGVSVFRALRPIAALALTAYAADQYVMLVALPNANQTFREITFNVVASKAETDVKPRTFYQGFPNRVIYVRDVVPAGGWRDVFLADNTRTDRTTVFFAARGRLLIDHARRSVQLVLEDGTSHTTYTVNPESYEPSSFARLVLNLDADAVFKRTTLLKGDNEMTIGELRSLAAENKAHGLSYASQLFTIQQKFSIPLSCLVLAAIGLAFGASNRKDGTLASFALGSGVIFAYYVLLYMGRAGSNGGRVPPSMAPWIANIVMGAIGAVLLFWRARASGESVRIPMPGWLGTRRGDPDPAVHGAGSTPARRVVLVIRIPHIDWPRPTLLDLYVARRYLSVFLLAFVSLIGIFYIATFLDLADKLFRGSTTTLILAWYFFYQTPQYVYYILPLAALLSTLVTIGVLTKNSELIVMRACGVSMYRSALPLVLFAVILSGMLFGLQEYVLADSNRQAAQLNAIIRGFPTQPLGALSRRWVIGHNGDIYHYEQFDPHRNQFDRLSIFTPDASSWRLEALTYAADVSYRQVGSQSVWTARHGWDREFSTVRKGKVLTPAVSYRPFTEKQLPIETPGYFKADEPEADRMTFGELKQYIERMQTSGYYVIPYQVQLQKKVAFPAVALVMTLLAVPFAATTGRSGALYGVGIGISLAIVYWTAQSVFGAMGAAGLFPPLLAAWAPNILFAAAAGYMLLTVRT